MNTISPSLKEIMDMMGIVYGDIVVNMLKNGVRGEPYYSCIVAIESGGIPFGKYLAHKMCLEMKKITIKFRDADNNILSQPFTEGVGRAGKINSKFLLVDDIVDSGNTVRYFEENTKFKCFHEFDLATLHWCPSNSGNVKPTYYGELNIVDSWIQFPWERVITFDEVWSTLIGHRLV